MSDWIEVCQVSECPPGASLELVAADRVVALYNIDGAFFALDGVCPHQGGPLGKGQLDGCVVTCPWHGWQFDVRSGQHQLSASVMQPTIPVRVEEKSVFVERQRGTAT